MKISTNFTYDELVRSSTADREGIYNKTSRRFIINNAKSLALNVLEPVRAHYGVGFSPNSWYRGEQLEEFICKDSYEDWCRVRGLEVNQLSWVDYFNKKSHPDGQAADIEIPGIDNDDLYCYIKDNLEFDQLIRELRREGDPSSGWVHVSYNKGNNRGQAFSYG